MMIEPTETESKETLDAFIDAMIQIAKEVEETPEIVQEAPHTTVIKRLDETLAARKPILRYQKQNKIKWTSSSLKDPEPHNKRWDLLTL